MQARRLGTRPPEKVILLLTAYYVMSFIQSAKSGDLEMLKVYYQKDTIDDIMMKKAINQACKFGNMDCVKFMVEDCGTKVIKENLQYCKYFKQSEIYDYLLNLHNKRFQEMNELREKKCWEKELMRNYEEEEKEYFEQCCQRALTEHYDEFSRKWDKILEKEEKEKEQQKIREKENEIWLEEWMKERKEKENDKGKERMEEDTMKDDESDESYSSSE